MKTGKRKKKIPVFRDTKKKLFVMKVKKKKNHKRIFVGQKSIHEKELLFHDSSCATIWFWALLRS